MLDDVAEAKPRHEAHGGVLFVMGLTNPFVRHPTDMPIAGNYDRPLVPLRKLTTNRGHRR